MEPITGQECAMTEQQEWFLHAVNFDEGEIQLSITISYCEAKESVSIQQYDQGMHFKGQSPSVPNQTKKHSEC